MKTLSILIPSLNEPYLQKTLEDLEKHIEGDTEILWEEDPGIGQRALMNKLARKAKGKYLMKVDAHCSLSQGFDVEMMRLMNENTVVVPTLATLDVKNWTVPSAPHNSNFLLDTNLVFQYGPEIPKLIHETMTIQGSGFMCNRDKYFELNLCDEAYGSWGMQGTEVALKTWLSGGRVLSTKSAYMGHWFRTKAEGGPGFPYERDMVKVKETFSSLKELFLQNKWPHQTRSLQSLIEQFQYPMGWTPQKVKDLCTPF